MYESFDKPTVLRLLGELDRGDRSRTVFGASTHQYRLNPPLPLATVEAFEARHGIVLPGDYRMFLIELGNGGAGPHYGVFPLGQHDDGYDVCDWAEGGLVGDVTKPFPHEGPWNLPGSFWANAPDPPSDIAPEDEDRLYEAWDQELAAHYWNPAIMDGAIPICNVGCALRQWLVVNGGQKGYVWGDHRADEAGVFPIRDREGQPQTFSRWYMSWLLETLGKSRSLRSWLGWLPRL